MPSSNSPTTPAVILGIDPGIATTGYAFLQTTPEQQLAVLEYGVIRTPAHTPLPQRLLQLQDQLTKLITEYSPTVAGCEELFFTKNVKTAITVAQARGVIIASIATQAIPIHEFTPSHVKQAITGHGTATKEQVQYMTQHHLQLNEMPSQDDAADALAIAVCAAHRSTNLLAQSV